MIVAQGKIVFAHTYPSKAEKQKHLNRTKNPQKTLQYNIHEEWGVGKEFFLIYRLAIRPLEDCH
jgi:hypothetical protein